MENNDTPEFYADRLNKLLAPLDDKRQEMKACLTEMRRMFSALKAKVKKYEKIIAALDETKESSTISYVSYNTQLAMNKFEGIQKRINRCVEAQNYFEKNYKELPKYIRCSDYELTDRINRTMHYYYNFRTPMVEGEDMIRIANKHLKKSDDHFAYMRRLYRNYPVR